jgi:DNA-binding SARP family transcriptional activator
MPMAYEFRILGPVGLGRDGEAVPLGPPKRMAMAAALLLEANRPVPVSQLTEAMWPEPPPRSAVANLRTHVSALRRILDGRLVSRPRAYQLRVAEAELDAAEFARLARAGREALAGGDPASALARLGQALALWRGAAGDGLPRGTSLEARLVTLDEQRLDTFEDHIQARLHTREFTQIAADLRRHVAGWPVRERSWELLMLALYRSGNVCAALDAYHRARTTLGEQLGIEPGPRMQELHRAMLSRQPWLDGGPRPRETPTLPSRETATMAPRAAGAPAPPPMLPPAGALAGRDAERAALVAALRAGPGVVVIGGPAGVGKSALAVAVADAVAAQFPDGQVLIDLAGDPAVDRAASREPAAVLAAAHRALSGERPVPPEPELEPAPVAVLAGLCRSLLAGRRVLLLLDGAAHAGQVRPLLAGHGGATLLVTSRLRRLSVEGARQVELAPLALAEAVVLMSRYAGAERAGSEPEAMRELARRCAGLPLALRIAGEWLAARPDLPARTLAAHLARRPLDGLRHGDLSVRDALAADLRAVAAEDPLAARLFPLLGPEEVVTPDGLAAELDEDPSQVFFALERLVDRWLAEPASPPPGAYQAAGLARAYADELAGTG